MHGVPTGMYGPKAPLLRNKNSLASRPVPNALPQTGEYTMVVFDSGRCQLMIGEGNITGVSGDVWPSHEHSTRRYGSVSAISSRTRHDTVMIQII